MSFFRSFQAKTPETLLGGRYKLIEKLGAGGFGQTFLAEDLHLPGNPRCVLKRLQPQFTDLASLQTAKRLFDTEAKVLYQLGSHDQIPRLLAHFEHEQDFYLAQELIVGHPLTQELAAGQTWAETQVVALLQDILHVLTFVHEQDVIHRDIKPANLIRRGQDGKIILIDFGAVKRVSTQLTQPNSGATQTIAIGTPGYMPNEQLAGNPRFSSDVYAVGMVAIQALTGISPRSLNDDPQTSEIQWRHHVPQINPELAAVLDKMTRYDFRVRYATASEALRAIEQLSITPDRSFPKPQPLPSVAKSAFLPAPTTPLPSLVTSATSSERQSSLNSTQLAGSGSQAATEPLRHSPLAPTALTGAAIWRSTLTQLRQLDPKKLLLPLAGLTLVSGLVALVKPAPTPQLTSQLSSAPSKPAATPDVKAQAATLVTQATQLQKQKKFQQAIDLYKQAIALNVKNPEAHWGRCYSLNVLEKFTDAIAACDAALKLKPSYAEALWSKGYALDRQEKDQQALSFYEQAIALKPDFAEAWSNKGTALLQLKRPAEAVAAFDQATRLKPDLAEAWNSRGLALWNLRRFDEAVISVDRAIQVQPNYQDALSLKQQMRERIGR